MTYRLLKSLIMAAIMVPVALLYDGQKTDQPCPNWVDAALAEEARTKPSPWDIPAARIVADPNPTFNGVAVDPTNNLVVMSDANRKSLLLYDRAGSACCGGETPARASDRDARAASAPLRQIIGPETNIGMVAGVTVDPRHREIFTVNNDIEDTMVVMSYAAQGNAKPLRLLPVPHQAWGLALSALHNEVAVTVEIHNAVVFYRREANGIEAPLRSIRGDHTGLADPHGIYWDEAHEEIGVANHGNFRGLVKNTGGGCAPAADVDESSEGGQFQPPSITIYRATAHGDEKPLRTIQGPRTELDWPMSMAIDSAHNEIVVANNGDNSILIFDRSTSGDRPPVRSIRGDRIGINRPMGLAIDTKNDEIWVSNFGDHSALVFARTADGNVAPKRVIRSAPAGTPTAGFGNPMALAYDSKREEILVPN